MRPTRPTLASPNPSTTGPVRSSGLDHSTTQGFRGAFAFCSNFHPCPVQYLGLTFLCSEAAFQAAKFTDPAFREQFTTLNGGQSKKLGGTRHPSFRPDWDNVRIQVMREVLEHKFSDPALRASLLATGNTELVEHNTWGDTFWGVCGGRGTNHLGKLLMDLRASLSS